MTNSPRARQERADGEVAGMSDAAPASSIGTPPVVSGLMDNIEPPRFCSEIEGNPGKGDPCPECGFLYPLHATYNDDGAEFFECLRCGWFCVEDGG